MRMPSVILGLSIALALLASPALAEVTESADRNLHLSFTNPEGTFQVLLAYRCLTTTNEPRSAPCISGSVMMQPLPWDCRSSHPEHSTWWNVQEGLCRGPTYWCTVGGAA